MSKFKNIIDDWFFSQWYSHKERVQLQAWCDESGNKVIIKQTPNGRWSGFHILDTNETIGLAGQPTQEDCKNWMERLGFDVQNNPS